MVTYLGTPEHRRAAFPANTADWLRRMWTEELSTPAFTAETRSKVAQGIDDALGSRSPAEIENERDRRLIALLKLVGAPPAHPA